MYQKIRNELKTGDIVLFSGSGFISNLIKFFTGSKWSHVGMVLKIEEFDFVCLWESTTLSNTEDVQGRMRSGVQLVQLSSRIYNYEGDIKIRRLNKPVPTANEKLKALRIKLKDRKYETSEAELARSALDLGILKDNKQDLSSVFCSELVAEAYKELGLIDKSKPSNEFTPADFDRITSLKNGFELV